MRCAVAAAGASPASPSLAVNVPKMATAIAHSFVLPPRRAASTVVHCHGVDGIRRLKARVAVLPGPTCRASDCVNGSHVRQRMERKTHPVCDTRRTMPKEQRSRNWRTLLAKYARARSNTEEAAKPQLKNAPLRGTRRAKPAISNEAAIQEPDGKSVTHKRAIRTKAT